jgi:crotonobetainyl-CoA:carnitine CoA-transferase CaiB-like acyl-CoA transferase
MTPQEKAEELVNKFYSKVDEERLLINKYWSNAKCCALIAADELIYETQFEVPNIRQRYWKEVKQEIEKL